MSISVEVSNLTEEFFRYEDGRVFFRYKLDYSVKEKDKSVKSRERITHPFMTPPHRNIDELCSDLKDAFCEIHPLEDRIKDFMSKCSPELIIVLQFCDDEKDSLRNIHELYKRLPHEHQLRKEITEHFPWLSTELLDDVLLKLEGLFIENGHKITVRVTK
jgi:hypothetical protein